MSLRLLDFDCKTCGREIRDELMDYPGDPFPTCCGAEMTRQILSPLVDAPGEVFDPQSDRRASSYHHLDKVLSEQDSMGRRYTTVSKREFENMRWDAEKRREEKATMARREAVSKAIYRTRHGYVDHPPMEREHR